MLQIIPIYSPQTHTFINAFAKNGIKLKECLFAQAVCGMHGKGKSHNPYPNTSSRERCEIKEVHEQQ